MGSLRERVESLRHEVGVLHRAGLVHPLRPDLAVRLKLDANRWGPLAAAIRIAARQQPEATGLVDELGELSFADLDRRSDAVAAAWRGRGLSEDSVIAVLGRNNRAMVDALLGAGKLGARLILMNTGFAGPQLKDVSAREGVTAIVYDEDLAAVVAALPDHVVRFVGHCESAAEAGVPTIESLIREGAGQRVRRPSAPGAIVLLTSGTTGLPKGAPRQIRSTAVVVQLLDRIPLRAGESTLLAAPVFHGTGLAHLVLAFSMGSTVVLAGRFDAQWAVEAIERHRCTAAILVPTMLRRILDLGPEVLAGHDLSSLKILFCAGSALPSQLVIEAFGVFGDVLYNLYGSTEVAVASVATPRELRLAPGCAGRPPRGCVVRLFDAGGNAIDEPHVAGRIFVSNGLKFAGYTDGRSKELIDGLMSTGDIGHFDENGLLFIDGRDDDMIVSGGENVFPGEVEDLIASHPGIVEAYVVGVPDDEFGQRLAAYVVPRPGHAVSECDVKSYVKSNLARHKTPRDVVFMDELPRNATGKVARAQLVTPT